MDKEYARARRSMTATTQLASKDRLNRMTRLTKDTNYERDKMTTNNIYYTLNLQLKLYLQHAYVGCLT